MKYLLFLFFFVLYYLTSFTKIPFGDCVGFVVDFEKGSWTTVISATSHFLYSNFGVLLHKLLPMLTGGEIGKIISVSASAFCVSLMYILLMEIENNTGLAFWLSVAFGLSFTFWRNATNLEVYTFNAVFVFLFYLFLIRSINYGRIIDFFYMGLALGISFASHIQNILLLPTLLVFATIDFGKHRLKSFLPFFTSLFFILLIYFVNHLQAVSSDQVLRQNSNWVKNTFHKSLLQYLGDIIKAFGYLIYNFWFLIYFMVVGFFNMFKEKRKLSIILLVSIIFNLGFATFYAVTDNYTYFIISYIVLIFYAYWGILRTKENMFFVKLIKPLILFFPVFYFFSYKTVSSTNIGRRFNDKKEYKGGLKYYMLPWMNNNVGILEFTIERREATEPIYWMTNAAEEYINIVKNKYTIEQIKKQ